MIGPNRKTASISGWYGVLAILLAYALLSFGAWTSRSLGYQLLNLTGAAAFIVETFSKKDYQPMILNIIWLLIAAIAIAQVFIGR
jgi:hypothetical protein